MAIRKILTYPNPILKQIAEPIKEITAEIHELARDMGETMYGAPGIGLAANQIGVLKRIIVFDVHPKGDDKKLTVLINPEITCADGETKMEEGCLSVIDFSTEVRRSATVKVDATTLEGEKVVIEAEDLLAIVLQHEIDHLNGILFIDRISSLKRMLYRRHLKKLIEDSKE